MQTFEMGAIQCMETLLTYPLISAYAVCFRYCSFPKQFSFLTVCHYVPFSSHITYSFNPGRQHCGDDGVFLNSDRSVGYKSLPTIPIQFNIPVYLPKSLEAPTFCF